MPNDYADPESTDRPFPVSEPPIEPGADKPPDDGASDRGVRSAEAAAAPPDVSRALEIERADERPPAEPYAPARPYAWEDPYERYADVPASLELAYTTADLGLSPQAHERAFPYEQRRRRATGARARRIGRELVETVILAALIFFAVRAVVQNFRVEGQSMEPSMSDNEYLLVNKALYFKVDMDRVKQFLPFLPIDGGERHLFRAPQRGDVIVFKFPQDPDRDFIKRVIGVPGDTVEVRDGVVYINGAPLEENYILATPNYTYGPKTVPEESYFVLGDNRRNSFDSHQWAQSCPESQVCDFVPEENIIGQAWLRYWPLDMLGFVNNKVLKPVAP